MLLNKSSIINTGKLSRVACSGECASRVYVATCVSKEFKLLAMLSTETSRARGEMGSGPRACDARAVCVHRCIGSSLTWALPADAGCRSGSFSRAPAPRMPSCTRRTGRAAEYRSSGVLVVETIGDSCNSTLHRYDSLEAACSFRNRPLLTLKAMIAGSQDNQRRGANENAAEVARAEWGWHSYVSSVQQ